MNCASVNGHFTSKPRGVYATKILPTLLLSFILIFTTGRSAAQDTAYRHALRIYEDNDHLRFFGGISDEGYTNGTRLDYFYVKDHDSRFFLDRWLPKAGQAAVNTFGVGVMQTMYTPRDPREDPDVQDWPYSGALYLSHTLHSSNPVRGYNLQTELVGGVMGEASGAQQFQKAIHQVISSKEFMGWDKQYPTDILLNLNLAVEKRLWHYGQALEVIGGAQGMLGTMIDGASVYSIIRIGKMQPYFSGLLQQYSRPFGQRNKLQWYFFVRPALEWVGYNAVLEGGLFNGKSRYYRENGPYASVNRSISRRLDLGMVLSDGRFGLSMTRQSMHRLVDGIQRQTVGNLTLYVAF